MDEHHESVRCTDKRENIQENTQGHTHTHISLLVKWWVGMKTQSSLSTLVSKQPERAEKTVLSLSHQHIHTNACTQQERIHTEIL